MTRNTTKPLTEKAPSVAITTQPTVKVSISGQALADCEICIAEAGGDYNSIVVEALKRYKTQLTSKSAVAA